VEMSPFDNPSFDSYLAFQCTLIVKYVYWHVTAVLLLKSSATPP
jgi:hypothetical protein